MTVSKIEFVRHQKKQAEQMEKFRSMILSTSKQKTMQRRYYGIFVTRNPWLTVQRVIFEMEDQGKL